MLRLGITMRMTQTSHEKRNALALDWGRFLQTALPGIPWMPLPNEEKSVIGLLEGFGVNAFIFSGGDDWGVFPERDRTETSLLDLARQKNLPVLGVCRGAQVINRLCGGRLKAVDQNRHVAKRHTVFWGEEKRRVNSFHGFGIPQNGLGQELVPLAVDENGFVEAFCHDCFPWFGVLWHPEREQVPLPQDLDLVSQVFGQGREN